jgi:hypothetical protein
MPASKRKFWWCGGRDGCGHVVGEIGHIDMHKAGRVKVLLLYEQSLDVPPCDIPLLRERLISAFNIRCTLCSNQFEWYPNIESFNKLMANYK